MTPERWARVRALFDEAIELDTAPRAAFLVKACGEDADLLSEIQAMLEPMDGEFMREPVSAAAALRQAMAPVDRLEGARLGPWKLVRRIGAGGMGAVYAAARADQQFTKIVAVKIVKPGADSEEVVRRFHTERQVLAGLEHPNIARLLDGCTTEDGLPYLVMEYVEGVPVDRYCEAHRLRIPERLELFRTICAAVQYAHQNLVVHRDLKPGNILVTPEGVPKLLDFGIAKLLRPDYTVSGPMFTRTNAHPMTPAYASPEQIRAEPITTSSDIYSLGVILFELLTGRHPHRPDTHSHRELEQAICETDPHKPSRVAAIKDDARLLRGDLDTIVLMAMRKEPRHRYASAEHFSEDIRRYLAGFPVIARKAGVWYRASKFVGRHKAGSIAAALVSLGLIAAGAIALAEKRAAERRFEDLRNFANFVLNDFDDAIRQGPTQARTTLAAKGVDYLDSLAREKSSPSIRRDLVTGYLKNGEIQGNLYSASMGDAAKAESSYRKALAIAEELLRANPSSPEDQRNVALAHRGIGEALTSSGRRAEALDQYDQAFRAMAAIEESNANDPKELIGRLRLLTDLSSARALLLDPAGALQSYRMALTDGEKLPASYARRANVIAFVREQVAYYSALTGDLVGSEDAIRQSIAVYDRDAAADPKASRRRILAKAYKNLAEIQKRTGKNAEALETIRSSVLMTGDLLAKDSKNEQYQIDQQQAWLLEIELLLANGLQDQAKAATRRALETMKALADLRDAPFHHAADYAELLVVTPFQGLRNNAEALRYAHKAASITREFDPEVLHVLALAYEANGDPHRAAEADRKALALVPKASEFRRTLEAELAHDSK